MDPKLVRKYVNSKKKTFLLTIFLLIFLAVEFYYLNCYLIYVYPFCEFTWMYLAIALIVANFFWYFSGPEKGQASIRPSGLPVKEERPKKG